MLKPLPGLGFSVTQQLRVSCWPETCWVTGRLCPQVCGGF